MDSCEGDVGAQPACAKTDSKVASGLSFSTTADGKRATNGKTLKGKVPVPPVV
jgi:hypothetical protein